MQQSPSLYSSSTTSSDEELPIPRPQYTSSITLTSPSVTTLQLSTSSPKEDELSDLILPYPLRLDKDYIYQIGLKPDEFLHYCQLENMKLMFDDPMDVIDGFIQYRLEQGLDMGVTEECLNHLNNVDQIFIKDESLEYYVYDYIEVQILKSLHLPTFESPSDNQWSQIPFPTFDTSTLEIINRDLNIYPNRYNFKRKMHGNLNVFDLLLLTQTGDDQNIRLYHGTDIESVKKICQYGINLYAPHRLGCDFGPGFYVTDNFDDALYIAAGRGERNKTSSGIICFQFRETEFCQFNIQELIETAEESTNTLEWTNFVKLCRRRFMDYPHLLRRDAFRGGICNNAERVRQIESERPRMKIFDNRKPTQICVKSTSMASKLECSILGVYMIGVTTS